MSAHIIKKIQSIDDHIQKAWDRIAEDQIRIGNWTREREALYRDLSEDERKLLEPPAPPAPAEQSPLEQTATEEKT